MLCGGIEAAKSAPSRNGQTDNLSLPEITSGCWFQSATAVEHSQSHGRAILLRLKNGLQLRGLPRAASVQRNSPPADCTQTRRKAVKKFAVRALTFLFFLFPVASFA